MVVPQPINKASLQIDPRAGEILRRDGADHFDHTRQLIGSEARGARIENARSHEETAPLCADEGRGTRPPERRWHVGCKSARP